jgi:cell division protein FtsB
VRLLTLALLALLVLIQYPLWLGKGGWMRVWEVDRQLVTQNRANERLVDRNRALEGEVRDLQQGTGAIEERARYELGLMRSDEVFVQLVDPASAAAGAGSSAAAPVPGRATAPPGLSAAPAKSAQAAR